MVRSMLGLPFGWLKWPKGSCAKWIFDFWISLFSHSSGRNCTDRFYGSFIGSFVGPFCRFLNLSLSNGSSFSSLGILLYGFMWEAQQIKLFRLFMFLKLDNVHLYYVDRQ